MRLRTDAPSDFPGDFWVAFRADFSVDFLGDLGECSGAPDTSLATFGATLGSVTQMTCQGTSGRLFGFTLPGDLSGHFPGDLPDHLMGDFLGRLPGGYGQHRR